MSLETQEVRQHQDSVTQRQQTKLEQFKYSKRKVLRVFQNIGLLTILLIVERIFYRTDTNFENAILPKLQISLNLVDEDQKRYKDIWILDMLSKIDDGPIFLMICTNVFITMYVGVDALIALKIMYTSYIGYMLMVMLQLIYTNPRPYWQNDYIYAPKCLTSFSNPCTCIGISIFIIFYTYHCFKVKQISQLQNQRQRNQSTKSFLLIRIVIFFSFAAFAFTQYITGVQYIITMILGLIYARLYYKIIVLFESQITNIIKHTSIMNIDSKKYVFYSIAILILFEILLLIILDNENPFLYFKWIDSIVHCLKQNNEPSSRIPYNMLVGPSFTFNKSCVFAAQIGSLFGVANCFREIKTLEWYKGPLKKKIVRIMLANLFTLPSWFFMIYIPEISQNPYVNQVGFSEFVVNQMISLFLLIFIQLECVNFFILYLFLFGSLPLKIFKNLKLNASGSTAYVVINASDV